MNNLQSQELIVSNLIVWKITLNAIKIKYYRSHVDRSAEIKTCISLVDYFHVLPLYEGTHLGFSLDILINLSNNNEFQGLQEEYWI